MCASQPGVTSTAIDSATTLTASDFFDLDLFVSILPDAYTTAELGLLSSFGAMAGPLFLLGENETFNASPNAALNDLLAELGSGLRLGTESLDNGFQVDGGTVAADPLTAGAGALTYAFTNTVSGGTSLATTRNGSTFIATDALTPPPIPRPRRSCRWASRWPVCSSCAAAPEFRLPRKGGP